jgi:lysophospholipase
VNDITTIINQYDEAPLIEINGFSSPKDPTSIFIKSHDAKKQRVVLWNTQSDKGTIVLQSGRTEFIEKYYEVIEDFISRGYCVAAMDWRGQGLSDRTGKNPRLGHIDSFSEYDSDFNNFLRFLESIAPKPWIGFGHSMGGCLVASHFLKNDQILSGIILCAPMLSVKIPSPMKIITRYLGNLSKLGFRDYALNKPSWDSNKGWLEEPFDENQLTSDENRFNRTFQLITEHEKLGVKGISIGWAHEAIIRTEAFSNGDYYSDSQKPILLLNATQDKLVSPSANLEALSSYKNLTVKDIDCKHEIFMEVDSFRKEAWESVDKFLKSFNF